MLFYIQESIGDSRSPKSPKKDQSLGSHRHNSSPSSSHNSNSVVNGSTSPQITKNGHKRVAAKSESNSTHLLPSKPAELSSARLLPKSDSDRTTCNGRSTEQHISPEEKPRRVVGWREGEKESEDATDSGPHHLAQRAKGNIG